MASSEGVKALNALYRDVTGEDMYTGTIRYEGEPAKFTFQSGTVQGQKAAEGYMRWVLNRAREGRAHRALVYDGVHPREGAYYFDSV